MNIGIEYKKLFNYIFANVIHFKINADNINLESLNKSYMDKYFIITERIFSYIITGKLDNIIFTSWENNIISLIPDFIIPKYNPLIVERLF